MQPFFYFKKYERNSADITYSNNGHMTVHEHDTVTTVV